MKTKHLLTALVLPAVFAACTSEEIPTENTVKENLGNRPVVEDVTFSFGDAQSRAAIAGWGTFNFEEGDKLGVALIDNYNAANNTPILRYNLLTQSINTNYIFTSQGAGEFTSEAPMVEGNYVFYFPYNTQRTRNQIVTNLPKEQALTALEDGTYTSYPSVLAYSVEKGAPLAVAYDFISAADAGNELEGTLKQIYAAPLITIQNGCTKLVDGEAVPTEMTIKQISLSIADGSKFTTSAPLEFATNNHTAHAEAVVGHNTLVSNHFNEAIPTGNTTIKKGSWISEIKGRSTSDLIGNAVTGGESSEIVLTLAQPVTVAAEGSFSFYAVIPAEAYVQTLDGNGDVVSNQLLKATIMNAEGLSESVTFANATLSAGQRYPEEEINDDNTLNNDIKGMSLTGVAEEFDALEGVLVSNVDELINSIKNFKVVDNNYTLKIRMSGTAVINKRVADFLKLTTTKATSIQFVNDVTIEGTSVVLEPAKSISFATKATVASGAAATFKKNNISGKLEIAAGGSVTHTSSNLTSIVNSGTLTITGTSNIAITNKGTMNVTNTATFNGAVANGGTNIVAEINVSNNKTAHFASLTNYSGSTVNNLGTITANTFRNRGTVVNGSEEDIVASLVVSANQYLADTYAGVITNYGEATVGDNYSTIEMMSVNAKLTVDGAAVGTVVNDALASVTDDGGSQIVTYTLSGVQTNETFDPSVLTLNSITKVIFDGVVLKMNADIDMSAMDLYVKSNSSVNSLNGANAGLKLYVKSKTVATSVKLTENAGASVVVGAPAVTPAE